MIIRLDMIVFKNSQKIIISKKLSFLHLFDKYKLGIGTLV